MAAFDHDRIAAKPRRMCPHYATTRSDAQLDLFFSLLLILQYTKDFLATSGNKSVLPFLIIISGFVYHRVVIMKTLAVDHDAMEGGLPGESFLNY